MPTLPWTTATTTHDARGRHGGRTGVSAPETAVVMASRFRLRSFHHVGPFLVDAMRVRRLVLAAEGALGVSLAAHPLRREFWTLSAWRGRPELEAMARAEPHRAVMRRYNDLMADAAFAFWEVPVADLAVSWDEARRRVEAAERSPRP